MKDADSRDADSRDADFLDADFPAEPYPGARPQGSFVHENGGGRYLDERDVMPAGRLPVLAYGSNACPSKITWMREAHGLSGPVIVVRVAVRGIAAVWAAGLRIVDDQRPATLAADPGAHEIHAVWFATPDQIEALDRCEGRGERYDLAELHTGEISLMDGRQLIGVLAYVGRSRARMPLLVDGAPVRCADVDQQRARHLRGVPAAGDGLRRTVV